MRRMIADQPPATTAGPRPKGMMRAPLPESDQPLPARCARLRIVVRTHRPRPATRPRTAISPVNHGSFTRSGTRWDMPLLEDLQLRGWEPCLPAAPAKSESEQHDLIDPALIFGDGHAVDRFADFAGCRFELVPDIAFALSKKRVLRVDHDDLDGVFDDCLARRRSMEPADFLQRTELPTKAGTDSPSVEPVPNR